MNEMPLISLYFSPFLPTPPPLERSAFIFQLPGDKYQCLRDRHIQRIIVPLSLINTQMRKTILILLSILTFYGCRYNVPPSVKEALSTAEACMEENPDSALHILQNISHPENLRNQARADYALLYTQACDKTHLLPPTDSLIQTAVNYYKKEKNSINAAKSYFYLGRIKRNLRQDTLAVRMLLTALKKMPENNKSKLLMQIYFDLGTIYKKQNLYNKAMDMYRECHAVTKALDDSSLLFFPYRELAQTHLLKHKSDSALFYYQQALAISQKSQNNYWEANILNDISKVYLHEGDTLKANNTINLAIRKDSSATNLSLKGQLLYYGNKMDSARFYLKKSCLSGNLYSKTTGYFYLYKVEKKANNHPAAYAYNDSFNIYRDSILQMQRHQKVEELNTQYALAIQRKEIEAENRNTYYVIAICLIVLLSGAFGIYQYLKKKRKEKELKQEKLNSLDQTQTISTFLKEKVGEEIRLPETATRFKQDILRNGIQSFRASQWGKTLETVEKTIASGSYIKQTEQESLYKELKLHFNEFISCLHQIYPNMSENDIYFCILFALKYKSRTIVYCMKTPAGTLRTRKSRLKKNMAEETFRLIFDM